MRLFAATIIITFLLALSPHRRTIPPAIESDYCYQLIAADRLVAGEGFSSLQPVAPLQPWDWRYDWGFLTQWPFGYSLLVAGFRVITGSSTIVACQWISLIACAAAFVGWFAWIRSAAPRGLSSFLLALVAAGVSISLSSLVNPTTDILIIAAIPWILLLSASALTHNANGWHGQAAAWPRQNATSSTIQTPSDWSPRVQLFLAGLLSSSLCLFRYAAIFVPAGIMAFLIVRAVARRCRRTMVRSVVFCIGGAVPIVVLCWINSTIAQSTSATEQLNLGNKIVFAPSLNLLWTAWWRFTDLGFYNHLSWSHWAAAFFPIVLVALIAFIPRIRSRIAESISKTHLGLSTFIVFAGLSMLIAATALFGQKYNYIALDRYYEPLKPLYFLLFIVPLLTLRSRLIPPLICIAALVGSSWIVQQEWMRTYHRWSSAHRESTDYGQWATCFAPGANDMYRWLKDQKSPELIVVSNFHEYVALETGIPTLPIPKDRATLDSWVEKVAASRKLATEPRIIYVLDSSPRWRDYWIPPTAEIVRALQLNQIVATFDQTSVFEDSAHRTEHLATAATSN